MTAVPERSPRTEVRPLFERRFRAPSIADRGLTIDEYNRALAAYVRRARALAM